MISVFCNVVLSKVRFNPANWIVTTVTATVFMFFNYGGKEYFGRPLYPFLPWDGSLRTYFNAVFLIGMSTVFNFAATKFIVNKLPLRPV